MTTQHCILNSNNKFVDVVSEEDSSQYTTVLAIPPTLKENFEATWDDGTWIVRRIRVNTTQEISNIEYTKDNKIENTFYNHTIVQYLEEQLNILRVKMAIDYEKNGEVLKKYTDYENVLNSYIETCSNVVLKEEDIYIEKEFPDPEDEQKTVINKILNYKNYFRNLEDLADF